MDAGLATAVATVIVAIVAAGSAYASQRAASRASTLNTQTSSRVEMEREAYDRARAFDTETIKRQDAEIEELRAEILELRGELRDRDHQIHDLRNRIFMLEHVGPLTINYQPPEGLEPDLEEEEDDNVGRSNPGRD